jgi:hypothetical protein
VKKSVLQQTQTQTTKNAISDDPDVKLTAAQEKEFTQKLSKRMATWKRTYRVFTRNCSIVKFMQDDENACKGKYKEELNAIYEFFSSDDESD